MKGEKTQTIIEQPRSEEASSQLATEIEKKERGNPQRINGMFAKWKPH